MQAAGMSLAVSCRLTNYNGDQSVLCGDEVVSRVNQVDVPSTQLSSDTGERDAAKAMAVDLAYAQQRTIGADKNNDSKSLMAEMRRIVVTPRVAQNHQHPGCPATDGRTTRHEGYAKSINGRGGIKKVHSWIKQ